MEDETPVIDPDATLNEMRRFLDLIQDAPTSKAYEDYAIEILDRWDLLDKWLTSGGKLPSDWAGR